MGERILVVEDEPSLARNLMLNLEAEGYAVDHADDLASAQTLLGEHTDYHLLLVDWMLPDGAGVDLVGDLRARGARMPICMLTARTTTEDVVAGLGAGADDYVGKPFALDELLGRIAALLRRAEWTVDPGQAAELPRDIALENRRIDLGTGLVYGPDGSEERLTGLELRLLRYLVAHADQVVDRADLLRGVWEIDDPDRVRTRTIDTFVGRLRKRLEADPAAPRHILTEHGSGYRFVP